MQPTAPAGATIARQLDSPQPAGPAADGRPAVRCAVYTALLVAAGVWVMFTNLGGPRIEGDEARYALCVDQMRRTGEWLSPQPHPPYPYFEKPPLYMWLTAATYRVVPGFELKYRFWSAALAVACVALTCVLGATLLQSPEAGLLGGVLLLTNRQFLLEHGARHGGMDSGLTLLLLVILLLYRVAVTRRSHAAAWGAWAGVGVAAGLASLFKPLMGGPMLLLVALHAAALGRRAATRRPRLGLLVAVVVSATVAGPWYVVQAQRFGREFTGAVFGASVVKRLTVGLHHAHVAGPMFYPTEISRSSVPFALFLPAAAFVIVAAYCAARARHDRDAWAFGLLATASVGWVALFSLSTSKFLHYAYPAFPAIALSVAALFREGVRRLADRFHDPAAADRLARGAWLVTAAVLLVACCRLGYSLMPQQQKKYVPWEIYRTFRPAIDDGRAQLVFCDVPATPEQWGDETAINSADMFYLSHMRGAARVADAAALAPLLAARRPTVLLLSRGQDPTPLDGPAELRSRFDDRFVYEHRAFTAAAVDSDGLFHQRLRRGSNSPYLQFHSEASARTLGPADGFPFDGDFMVRVTPPLPEDCRLTVTVRRSPETRAERVRRTIHVGGERTASEPVPLPFTGPLQLAVHIERDPARPGAPVDVRFRVTSADDRHPGEAIRGTVTDVRLDVQPRVPVDNPGRLAR